MTRPNPQHDDPAFEAQLRSMLHRAADPIEPDPGGWRQLNARVARRRRAWRAGGLALAGAAAAIVAVGVIPTADDQRVELAPGDLATQPNATEPAVTPGATDSAVAPSPSGPVGGGILYSDGSSIHVADLDGTIQSTPAALGASSQTITDLDVQPGGTTDTFTTAYRVDGRSDVSEGCGDVLWVHVPGPDEIGTSGLLPRAGAQAQDCLGAPVFASDGSALLWFGELGTGEAALQAIDWADDGPVDGTLVTWPLDVPTDPDDPSALRLVSVRMPDAGAESGTDGKVRFRAPTPDGPALHSLPIQRQGDGALALTGPWAPVPVRADVRLDPVVAVDGGWELGRPTGDELQGIVDDDIGLAYTYLYRTTPTGGPIEPGLSATSTLTWAPGQPLYLDAIGDTAVMGNGGPMHLAIIRDGTDRMHTALPDATAAALLAQPAGDQTDTDSDTWVEPAPPVTEFPDHPGPSPLPSPDATETPMTTPSPTGAPTETARPADTQATPPPAVRDTAQAVRQAAQARDWAAIETLIPSSGFTSNFGGETDHVAFYQREEANGIDVLGTLADLLADAATTNDGGIWVWPAAYAGEGYLGYRVGIEDDGTWIFYVAGD